MNSDPFCDKREVEYQKSLTFLSLLLLFASCGGHIGGNSFGTNTLNPNSLSAEKDSSSKITLTWTANSSVAAFAIAYNSAGSTPSSCANANNIVIASGNSASRQITGLSENTNYIFRICTVGNQGTYSTGITASKTTYPACDYTLTPLWLDTGANGGDDSGVDDFDEFQAFIDASVNVNGDAAGITAICLADGVDITTSSAATGVRLLVHDENLYIYAETGNSASIRNLRTDSDLTEHSGINTTGSTDLSLSNLTLSVSGQQGRVILGSGGSSISELSKLTITASGFHSEGIHTAADIGLISDVTINTFGNSGYGIEPQNGDITKIENVTITTLGVNAQGIEASVGSTSILHEISNVTITTEGNSATGIRLGDTASIRKMYNTTIRRSAAAVLSAQAIYIENSGGVFFDTANIYNNTICTILGGVPWTALLYAASIPGEYVAPTNPWTNAPGPFDAQTFPWGDASDNNNDGTTDWNVQTQWGGTCPN